MDANKVEDTIPSASPAMGSETVQAIPVGVVDAPHGDGVVREDPDAKLLAQNHMENPPIGAFSTHVQEGRWSSGLCDCCEGHDHLGAPLCCMSFWCPCVQYGYNVERLYPHETVCGGKPGESMITYLLLAFTPQVTIHMLAFKKFHQKPSLPSV